MFATLGSLNLKVLAIAAVAAAGLVAGTQQASARANFSFGLSISRRPMPTARCTPGPLSMPPRFARLL